MSGGRRWRRLRVAVVAVVHVVPEAAARRQQRPTHLQALTERRVRCALRVGRRPRSQVTRDVVLATRLTAKHSERLGTWYVEDTLF